MKRALNIRTCVARCLDISSSRGLAQRNSALCFFNESMLLRSRPKPTSRGRVVVIKVPAKKNTTLVLHTQPIFSDKTTSSSTRSEITPELSSKMLTMFGNISPNTTRKPDEAHPTISSSQEHVVVSSRLALHTANDTSTTQITSTQITSARITSTQITNTQITRSTQKTTPASPTFVSTSKAENISLAIVTTGLNNTKIDLQQVNNTTTQPLNLTTTDAVITRTHATSAKNETANLKLRKNNKPLVLGSKGLVKQQELAAAGSNVTYYLTTTESTPLPESESEVNLTFTCQSVCPNISLAPQERTHHEAHKLCLAYNATLPHIKKCSQLFCISSFISKLLKDNKLDVMTFWTGALTGGCPGFYKWCPSGEHMSPHLKWQKYQPSMLLLDMCVAVEVDRKIYGIGLDDRPCYKPALVMCETAGNVKEAILAPTALAVRMDGLSIVSLPASSPSTRTSRRSRDLILRHLTSSAPRIYDITSPPLSNLSTFYFITTEVINSSSISKTKCKYFCQPNDCKTKEFPFPTNYPFTCKPVCPVMSLQQEEVQIIQKVTRSSAQLKPICNETFLVFDDKVKRNQSEAQKICMAYNTTLLQISHCADLACVAGFISNLRFLTEMAFWTSGTSFGCPGYYVWCPSGGQVSPHLKWQKRQPNDPMTDHCLTLEVERGYHGVGLNDKSCNVSSRVMCQIPKLTSLTSIREKIKP